MSKKTSIAQLFKTEKSIKQEEVYKSIKRYCLKLNDADMKEVHINIMKHFELVDNDYYFKLDNFISSVKEIQSLHKLKMQKANDTTNSK